MKTPTGDFFGHRIDAASGVLAGTPAQAGRFALAVTATDSTTGTPDSLVQNCTPQVAARIWP